MNSNVKLSERRKQRNRYNLKQKSGGRARLCVIRSNRHIYAQVIDDSNGVTLASASTEDKALKLTNTGNVEAAFAVGKSIGEKAKKAGVEQVVFDRGECLYHGRVKAVADGAREAGLDF